MKKILILLLALTLIGCSSNGNAESSGKDSTPSVTFTEEDVIIDMNEEIDLNAYVNAEDGAEYQLLLDEENSKLIINYGDKTIEKNVTIIPKKEVRFEDLDMEKGFIWARNNAKTSYPVQSLVYNEYKNDEYLGDDEMIGLRIENIQGSEYDLMLWFSATFGIKGTVIIDDPTNFTGPMEYSASALDGATNKTVVYDRENIDVNFRYYPYQGELPITVKAGSLKVRSGHSLDAEQVGTVKENETYTSYERAVDGWHLWHRIGDNQWIAGTELSGNEYYVEINQ